MAYPDYTNNFDSKWKDQSTPCKYDVDDPTFCSPMSVLSGLVSGFCERQAVVNSSFVTGTTASPVTSDWYEATQEGRDAIVSKAVQHVALHDLKPSQVGAESYKGPVDGSFYPADHTSVLDGGTTKVTTYMTHMDGLIDSLVQTGEYKTDITGTTAYTTFDQLAASASAAVAGTVSACSLAVSGGTAYSSEFMPAFPKAWALERKWMMEQLRYTGGGAEPMEYYTAPYDILGSARQYWDPYTVYNGSAFDIYNDIITNGGADGDLDLTTSEYASSIPNTNSFGLGGLINDVQHYGLAYDPFKADYPEVYMRGHCTNFNVSAVDITAGTVGADGWSLYSGELGGLLLCKELTVMRTNAGPALTIPVSISFAQGSPRFQSNGGIYPFAVVSNGMNVTAQDNLGYEIKSGGTCTIPAGVFADSVVVSSGGSLHMANGAKAASVSVLDGGVFTGFVNSYEFNTHGFYMFGLFGFNGYDYPTISLKTLPLNTGTATTYTVVTGNTTVNTAASYQAYYVKSGGTLTLNAFIDNSVVWVDDGGSVVINSGGGVARLYILPGGSCVVNSDGSGFSVVEYLVVFPTGHFEMHRARNQDWWPTTGIAYQAVIAPDCEFILDEAAILADPDCRLTSRCMLYVDEANITGGTISPTLAGVTTDGTNALTRTFSDASYLYVFSPLQMCSSGTTQPIHQGWNSFSNTTFAPNSVQASIVVSAGTTSLPEPPKSGVCIGYSNAYVLYRCAIEAVDIPMEGGGTPIPATDHYTTFRLRQTKT